MKIRYLYILSGLVMVISGCTEKLDTDYKGKSDNYLVVNGEISTDTTAHTVKLSRTVDFNASESPAETGAIVIISDGENTFPLTEKGPGIYQTDSNVYGTEGKEYTLFIQTTDGKTYSATSKINRLSNIDSIVVKYEKVDFFGSYFYKVIFNGQEPAGKGDCYIWNLYLNGKQFDDTLSKYQFQSDDYVDGQYVSDFDLYWLEPDKVPDDTTVFTVEMESIPKNYYQYISEVLTETAWRGSPFDPTPANVSTNIQGNGAVGFFIASEKKRKSVVHIKSEEEKKS